MPRPGLFGQPEKAGIFWEWCRARLLPYGALFVAEFVRTSLEGDDDYELYCLGVARERFRYPVIKVEVRVAVTGPVRLEDPAPEAAEEAAGLLLGLKKVPWWKRW